MSISTFARAASGTLLRHLWNRSRASGLRRRVSRDRFLPAIDQLETRRALAITTPLSIGGTTVASFIDAPTGPGNASDFVTVSIEGTKGTVIFNKGAGVADGNDIQTIDIIDASPDFQLTFNATVGTANAVPYGSDGIVHLGVITTANVIRGINTVRGPLTNVAAAPEINTSAIHLYTFNDGTVSGSTVNDLIGGANGTLFNGASVSGGQLVLADNSGATGPNVQYMSMPDGVLPDGSTAATFELWFTASASSGVWGRGFDLGTGPGSYLFFSPLSDTNGSRAAITEGSGGGERLVNGATPYNDNTQHLATVTVDNATQTLAYYIDGVAIGSVALAGTNLSGLEAVNNFLGRSQYAQDPGFIGSMNQFAIYDRVLSPAQVAANYAAGPISGALSPFGFTQTSPGSNTLVLEGDQTAVFPVGAFVCATPLLSNTTVGGPSFGTVLSTAFDAVTNKTTLILDNTTAAGTTAGALTLAETIQPEFRLTSFVGVNFSNRTLTEGGGIFVDVVEGADTVIDSVTYENLGILLSEGLLAYSTIGIRRELASTVLLGTTRTASADGRVFIESATPESLILIGAQNYPISKNSTIQIVGGAGEFGAGFFSSQPFDGIVNLGNAATGSWIFNRGVGSRAVLNATSWVGQTVSAEYPPGVIVNGDFAGSINATFGPGLNTGDISLLARNLTATARVNGGDDVSFATTGSVLKGATIAAGNDVAISISGSFAGSLAAGGDVTGGIGGSLNGATIAASSDLALEVGGSIVNSTLSSYSAQELDVAGSIRNSKFSTSDSDMSIDVRGSVTNSSFNVGYDYDLSLNVGGSLSGSTLVAGSDVSVAVTGNVTNSVFTATYGDVTLDVGGDFLKSKIVTGDNVDLTVGRDALGNTILGDDDLTIGVGRNFSGVARSASSDLLLNVGGSVLKGSSFSSGEDTEINVTGNFDASTTSRTLRFLVGGNVSQASRIVAQSVGDWRETGSPNFGIGGRFDGIVNVGLFDAVANFGTVTLIGNGAGTSARFYVDRFATDNLVFNGNFSGNLRILQDLVANLQFNGSVDRITIGGRVGSYEPGNTITPILANIVVTGTLKYLNTNSYFQSIVAGRTGIFWNNSIPSATTGSLITGRYLKVVPNLQTQPAPGPLPPQSYTVPSVPTSFSASNVSSPDGIQVSFAAPVTDGNLPIVYYQYSTNATAGSPSWRRFDNPAQGPGTNIRLTVDSAGGAWIPGNTYQVSVRAVNALGQSVGTTYQDVTLPI